jgi:hypothetical protein
MKRKCLFIALVCITVGLTAFSGAFAICTQRRCYEGNDRLDCQHAQWEYEDCLKEEKAAKEAKKAAAEKEQREKEEAKEPKKNYNYPFMDDIRDLNKAGKY